MITIGYRLQGWASDTINWQGDQEIIGFVGFLRGIELVVYSEKVMKRPPCKPKDPEPHNPNNRVDTLREKSYKPHLTDM